MVRLVVTDFSSKEDFESFYNSDEFEAIKEVFVYDNYVKTSAYLPRSEVNENIYSLNLLSKKYLPTNSFLVFITDSEFYILFNHKTIYSAKINENFITDDMIKSVLISKHLTMLSSGGEIEKIYYIIDSKYKYAVENILKQNTKNEKNQIIAEELGHINTLVKKIPEMDTSASFFQKNSLIVVFLAVICWTYFYGLDIVEKSFFSDSSVSKYEQELKIETRLNNRNKVILSKNKKKYEELISCVSSSENEK